MNAARFFLSLLLCLALVSPARAQTPERVKVGTYVINITDLDLKSGSYTADFYIWFLWKGKLSPAAFEVMNGSETTKERNFYQVHEGTKYAVYRCTSKLKQSFDFRPYPLDRHSLKIEIEDGQHDVRELIYEPDLDNTKIAPEIQISGWDLEPAVASVRKWTYPTTYGDPTLPPGHEAHYSRFQVEMPIRHAGMGIYLKSFLALFISVAIAFLAVFIPATQLEARLGLGVAAVFGAVSSQVLLAQNLPETPHFTLADKLHVLAYFFIFLALSVSCYAFYLAEKKEAQEAADRFDRLARPLLPIAFGLLTAIITLLG